MASLIARKYSGRNFLILRDWDGIDQPEYTPIFQILKEEIDFKGGRFAKFKFLDNMCYTFTVEINLMNELEDIINWISDNIINYWSVDIEYYMYFNNSILEFQFEDDNDAALFKLSYLDKIESYTGPKKYPYAQVE